MSDLTVVSIEDYQTSLFDPAYFPSSTIPDTVDVRFSSPGSTLAMADAVVGQGTLQADTFDEPFLFAQSFLPTGIVTDFSGNVFVSSEDAFVGEDGIPRSFGGSIITKYAPDGTALGKIQTGGLFSPVDVVGSSRFALDPVTGLLISLTPSGQINLIDPDRGQVSPFLDLKTISFQTNQVYDVATGQTLDFSGLIQPSLSSYGDIAVFIGNDFSDIYVSGIGAGQAFSFISRIRFSPTLGNSAQVILSSQATAAPNEQSPPGIAVNNQGTVLTTLGVNRTTLGNFSAPVAFSVGFNPALVTNESQPLVFSGVDLSSRGMTTDTNGNFYVATGTVGTSIGGANGSGAILVLSPGLELLDIYTQGILASAQDVAVSPDGQFLYATIGGNMFGPNGVIGFQLSQGLPQGDTTATLDGVYP